VWDFVKVTGRFCVLDQHELGRKRVTHDLLNDTFARLVQLLFDYIGVVA
jgi:hypothetical protein